MNAFNLTAAAWLLVLLNKHYDPKTVKSWVGGLGEKKGVLAHLAYSLFILVVIGCNLHYGLNG